MDLYTIALYAVCGSWMIRSFIAGAMAKTPGEAFAYAGNFALAIGFTAWTIAR